MNIPKVLSSEEVYKGKIISIRKDTLTRGDGRIKEHQYVTVI